MAQNFFKISDKSDLKEIRNISFVVSSIVATLVFSFLFLISKSKPWLTIMASVLTLIYMMVTSYVLYKIFVFSTKRFYHDAIKFRLVRYTLSYLGGFSIFLLVYLGSSPFTGFDRNLLYESTIFPVFIVESIIFTSLIMIFHSFVIVQLDRNKTKIENANLKAKSSEAVTLLLKQQIHPHFLFNSLHTIKVLYKDDLELGEEYLVQLADFLRATISNTQTVSATLEEEIKLFENYMNMQKMRFGDSIVWCIDIPDSKALKTHIPAFFLQPLAENAIKHNHFSKSEPLVISIIQDGIFIRVINNVKRKKYRDNSIGTGLTNMSERYQILYGEELEIEDNGEQFKISFKLKSEL